MEKLSKKQRLELAAAVLIDHFGNCDDEAFTPTCIACMASHIRRTMLRQPTPRADSVLWATEEIVTQAK